MFPASLDAHDSSLRGKVSFMPLTDDAVQNMVKARTFHP
jgi:hypothetical protein